MAGKASDGIGVLEQNETAKPVIEKGKSALSYGVSTASWFGSTVFSKVKTLLVEEEESNA